MLKYLTVIGVTLLLVQVTVAPHAQDVTSSVCTPSSGPVNLGFALKDLNGRDVRLSTYQGKVLLVNFWATWCAPCKVEIPGFKDLYDRYRARGVQVIGIGVDEPASVLKPYAREMKMNYPVLVGRDRKEVQEAFGTLVGVPTTIVINRDGTICQRHVGFTRKQTFEDIIRRLLGADA